MTIDITPPPAVVEFAEKNNCTDVKFYNVRPYKNKFTVYLTTSKKDNMQHYVILANDENIRFANDKEVEEITERFY